jgi:hypothetical protein
MTRGILPLWYAPQSARLHSCRGSGNTSYRTTQPEVDHHGASRPWHGGKAVPLTPVWASPMLHVPKR